MSWEKHLWPEWKIEQMIGSGACGNVYRIKRQDIGGTYYAALKVISCPKKANELENILDISKEIAVMEKLKGNTNIVSYEDHKIISNDDGLYILIRMELLTPLQDYLKTHEIDEKEVCRIGIDICKALLLCEKENIIHRDVKPGNIFVSSYGDFKLGDFSLVQHTKLYQNVVEPCGTYVYMAPEVQNGTDYDSTIDIYSLGLILYRLLNKGRGPFEPLPPVVLNDEIIRTANQKRLCSATFPKPINASAVMSTINLRACANDPLQRYSSPKEFQNALMKYSSTHGIVEVKRQISSYIKKAAGILSEPDIEDMRSEESNSRQKNMDEFFVSAGDL